MHHMSCVYVVWSYGLYIKGWMVRVRVWCSDTIP